MKKNEKINVKKNVILAIIFLILGFLIAVLNPQFSSQVLKLLGVKTKVEKVKKNKEKEAAILINDRQSETIKKLSFTNSQQEGTIDFLVKRKNNDSLAMIKLIKTNKCQRGSITYLKRKIKSLNGKLKNCQQPIKKILKSTVKQEKEPATKKAAIVKKDTTVLSPIYYEGPDNVVYFCINLGNNPGHYLPHLALIAKQDFGKNVQKNNQGGYNWVIFQLSDTLVGDYGVTKNSIFYVSKKLIDRYLNKSDKSLVEIQTTATDWQPKKMTLQGDYYIFKR